MNDENKFEVLLKKYDENMQRHIGALVEESEKNTQRHTGALSEDFQSKLSAVAEGVLGLNDKVEILTDNVGELTNTVNGLVNKVDQMEGVLKEVVHTQKMHTEMIGVLMEGDSERKIEIKEKVDRTEFVELKQTVLAMS
ncbi:MAG: hypothetical protein WC878_03985 [Candidatus Paceibacterota bacterium]|jgi:prophage DNA circulation protein